MTVTHQHDHQHDHQHQPQHDHRPAPEPHNADAGQGPVVLDIGDGVGALVLHAPPSMLGVEIDITPLGQDGRRSHVAVLARRVGPAVQHAAVYPALPEGTWQLWDPDGRVALNVDVAGGTVVEARWPG